jgi:hypothetical protein
VLYGELNEVENLLVKFDSFVWFDVLLTVLIYERVKLRTKSLACKNEIVDILQTLKSKYLSDVSKLYI